MSVADTKVEYYEYAESCMQEMADCLLELHNILQRVGYASLLKQSEILKAGADPEYTPEDLYYMQSMVDRVAEIHGILTEHTAKALDEITHHPTEEDCKA